MGAPISPNGLRVVSAIVLAILGWALTSLMVSVQAERVVINEIAVKLSVLETRFHDHLELVHGKE